MSRLNDLIRQVGLTNETLAADLQREVAALADRRSFGLNFERHVPEAVELPGRPIRRGDKVRILPPRGESPKPSDEKPWRVTRIDRAGDAPLAELAAIGDETQAATAAVEDLVVVAEFRDPIYPGLVSTGKVERGGDKPFHTVINAENYHALQALLFTHRGKVDCIYRVSLALALSSDGLHSGALAHVQREMHLVLDAARTRYPDLLKKAVNEIWLVRGQAISGRTGGKQLTYQDFVERADDRAIQVGFADAKKAFGGDVAHSYVNHLTAGDDEDDTLRDAYVTTSALAIVPEVRAQIDRDADELARKWFADYRVAIKGLSDARQQEYADIQALATEPQEGTLTRPRTRIEDYVEVLSDGQTARAPMLDRHLMSDADGMCPIGALNVWERELVVKELSRPTSVGWYRNPPRQSVDSLGVAYRDEVGNWRSMHPDFVFFNEIDGAVLPSIVDPHGHHLEDSLVKLRGLANFAKTFGDKFHRIEAVTKLAHSMRILDLKIPAVRDAILASKKPPMELYESDIAIDFDL